MSVARRLAHAFILVVTLVVGTSAAVIIVSQTAWFKNWIRAYIVREANLYLNGTLSIERLSGNLLYGLEMENIGVSMDGRQVAAVKDVGLDYNFWDFISKGLSVDNIRLDKPVIYLRRDGDSWTLSRLLKKELFEADRGGPARTVAVDTIGISDGSFVIDAPVGTSGVDVPDRIDHVDAKLSFKYEPVHYSIEITHVSFRGSNPALALNALSGGVAVRDDAVYLRKLAIRTAETSLTIEGAVQQYLTHPTFALQVSSDKVSVPELAKLFPALAGIQLQPQLEAAFDGPADKLAIRLDAQSSAGRVHAQIVANVAEPVRSAKGDISVRHVDLAPLTNDRKMQSDITADAHIDVRGTLTDLRSLKGTVNVDAPRIAAAGYEAANVKGAAVLDGARATVDIRGAAYGAAATARGKVTLPVDGQAAAVDLQGRAQHVDLRRLPASAHVPRAETNVNADYHLVSSQTKTDAARGSRSSTDVARDSYSKTDVARASRSTTDVARAFQASVLDLRFADSTIAGMKVAKGSTATIRTGAGPVAFEADATVANLDLQRVGAQFDIPALATDQYKSDINGHVTARGHAGSVEQMDVTASGTVADAAIGGGRVSNLTFDASLANDTAHVKAAGQFADVDPAQISGRPELRGRVGGTANVDATIASVSRGLDVNAIEGAGTVELQPSTIGQLQIERGAADATYSHSALEIRSLELAGPDLNATAKGTVALDETGSSNLTVHADTTNLAAIGAIIDQPVAGIARVDASITGNRRQLEAKGHIAGNDVKYRDSGALTVAGDFTAQVPELTVADATVSADSHATFVEAGGQQIQQLDGRVGYRQRQLEFDLTATEPKRSLGAAGTLAVHPDHHEVHLQKMALTTAGQTWQLAPGTAPAITYTPEKIGIADLKLVNGDQTISADGSFGTSTDALTVTAANVDVANVDAMLLREPQLTGRLNGTATVHAAERSADDRGIAAALRTMPAVDADFKIDQGGFRQFRYATFGGTVKLAGKGLTVDAKLEQSPTTFITAKGYMPTAIFTPVTPEERAAAHDAPVAAEDRVDLHVESTPIDLGLVQGFTTELTNVSGTLQAKLDIVGSAADPHPSGEVTLQKGAFTVKPTGVAYNTVEGKIELQPDRVHVGAITALDNHFNPVTISGDLAVHENDIGDVKVYIHTDDFKVVDNELGNLRVNSDLRIGGELRAPRVEGDLGVTTGMINLDPIIDRLGDSAYATSQTEYAADDAAVQPVQPAGGRPGPFSLTKALSALSMSVRVSVPDDLIVKANDLQAPGSPIGLGTLIATLGGDVRAMKSPDADLSLVGIVNTVRGTFTFQGRRFDIQRDGFVRFTGEPLRDLDPTLDLRTERTVQAVAVRVNVRGTLRQPEIVLASTPPLENADILSLILFNQPVNLLGETQQMSLVQQAQYLAGSSLTSSLSQSIAQALNLTEFDINLAPEAGTGPAVRFGQQLGPNLYVRVEQGLGDQSQTNLVVEYELQKWLRLQTNMQQGPSTTQQLFQRMRGSGVDLLFFFSY